MDAGGHRVSMHGQHPLQQDHSGSGGWVGRGQRCTQPGHCRYGGLCIPSCCQFGCAKHTCCPQILAWRTQSSHSFLWVLRHREAVQRCSKHRASSSDSDRKVLSLWVLAATWLPSRSSSAGACRRLVLMWYICLTALLIMLLLHVHILNVLLNLLWGLPLTSCSRCGNPPALSCKQVSSAAPAAYVPLLPYTALCCRQGSHKLSAHCYVNQCHLLCPLKAMSHGSATALGTAPCSEPLTPAILCDLTYGCIDMFLFM